MRWRTGRRSTNVEDRRGRGGMGRMGRTGRAPRLGIFAIIAIIIALFLGADPLSLLGMLGSGGPPVTQQQAAPPAGTTADDEATQFITTVLADTEDVWGAVFQQGGARYQPPTLVLYNDAVQSACGFSSAATGPFYCPPDQKVYLDLSFYHQLKRMGASGDFAWAYVLAHEVGHHVQNLLGTADQVRQLQARVSRSQANALSVRMELQADCYAGVWAHHAHQQRQILEEGDIEEGLAAAAAVGDDRIQKSAGRRVHPESFTHGTSEQRAQWFIRGLRNGDLSSCDTFES